MTALERGHDAAAITRAMETIDRLLAAVPVGYSESRDRGERGRVEPPLGVRFRVNKLERTVVIREVRYSPRKRRPR